MDATARKSSAVADRGIAAAPVVDRDSHQAPFRLGSGRALRKPLLRLDLAFTETEVQKSLALTAAFGAGWIFGLVSAALVLLKSVNERRHLRRSLSLAEAEVRNLRSMPIQDAD